jgi:HK97 family phage major capsid protein
MTSSTLSAGQRDELVGLASEAEKITKAATTEGRGLLPDEIAKLQEINAKAAPIRDSVKLMTELDDLKAMSRSLTSAGEHNPMSITDGSKTVVSAQTMGKTFTSGAGYKAFYESAVMDNGGQPHIPTGTGIKISPTMIPSVIEEIHRTTKALVSLNPVGAATSNGLTPLVSPDRRGQMFDYSIMQDRVLLGLINRIPTQSNAIEWIVKTNRGTNNAAIVAEAETVATAANKPESVFYDFALNTKTVDTYAHWIPVTKQALWDTPQLEAMINAFLADGIAEKLEAGVQSTILGTAGIQTTGSPGTDLDAIVDAIRLIRVNAKKNPNVVLMAPDDWYSAGFGLSKDTTGRYMLVDPTRSIDDGVNLWGRRLIISDQFTPNTAIVADLSDVIMWDRMQTVVSATDSHSDFFTKNIVVALAEARASFTVGYPAAICTVTAI